MAKKKANKQSLVPELRFPEFQRDGEWEERPLKAFLTEHKVKSDGKSEVHSVSVHKGVINQKEHLGRSFAANDTSNYNLVHPGDVIYTKSPTGDFAFGVVKQSQLQQNAIVSPLYGVFRPATRSVGFIIHCFFESPRRAYTYLDPITQKGAKNTIQITNQSFLSGAVHFPQKPAEQQKIADCLGSLDDLIAAHSAKLDALKTHKKGLMQQLFPLEGKTLPRLRFPEFQNAPKWVEKSIGNLGNVVTGSTPSTARRDYYDGGIPFVSPADISDLCFVHGTKTTLTPLGFDQTRPIKANSVLFVCIGSTIGKIAQNSRDCATNQQINAVVPDSTHSSGFVYFALSHNAERIAKLAGRQAVPIINKSLFSSVKLAVPKLPEQARIADCLSALDTLITAETDQITALKEHKKGLMQQLFPKPELRKV